MFESVSIVSGALPVLIVAAGAASVLLAFDPRRGTWKRQFTFGLPITAALVGLTAILVDGLGLIPYQFPNSYYLWVGLVLLAIVVAVIGFPHFSVWRRVGSIVPVVLSLLMALTLINQEYEYYPTIGSLFGADAQNATMHQLEQARAKYAGSGAVPRRGYTLQIAIPGKTSGFHARNAYVWIPPIWVSEPKRQLPVIELIAGVPGDPSDWTRAGFADETARDFANSHGGVAPIIVMPDSLGSDSNDTECVNSPRGQAETYLTVDVPAFIRSTFGASSSMAVGGLSAGGLCALMLALRHPDIYRAFGDYSGLTSPTVTESVDPEQTTRVLFGGSVADYNAHDPLHLLPGGSFPGLSGWFEVGTADGGPLAAQHTLVPMARAAGIDTCAVEIPGGTHSFAVWSRSFKDSLPWLSAKLGTTTLRTQPRACGPG